MATSTEHISTLHYSPFALAPLFEAFYKTAKEQEKSFLLSYLVLPLTLPEEPRKFLKASKSTSSLRTFCKDPSRLYGLPERVYSFRELTNKCMRLAMESGGIQLHENLSVTYISTILDTSMSPKDGIIAAGKLGKLLCPLDVPAVYRFLGVQQL